MPRMRLAPLALLILGGCDQASAPPGASPAANAARSAPDDPSQNLQRMYSDLEAAAAANAQQASDQRNAMLDQSFNSLEAEADAILNAGTVNAQE
jgi:hypothetical protein